MAFRSFIGCSSAADVVLGVSCLILTVSLSEPAKAILRQGWVLVPRSAGYGERSVFERYRCHKRCQCQRIGSMGIVFSPDEDVVWIGELHEPRQMTAQEREE